MVPQWYLVGVLLLMPEFTFSEMEDDPQIVMGMMHATDGHMGGRQSWCTLRWERGRPVFEDYMSVVKVEERYTRFNSALN